MKDRTGIVRVRMVRENLEGIGRHELTADYRLRLYRPGDEEAWLRIHEEADLYNDFTAETFRREFGAHREVLGERQYYLLNDKGTPVGTATAWWNDDYKGQRYGRVHWVAIVPAHQGKGLSRPMLGAALERMRELGHERAYLSTNSARLAAIKLYLEFGFEPEIDNEEERRVWEEIRARAGRR